MEALVSMESKKARSIYCTDPNNLSYDEACLNVYTQDDLPYPLKLYYQYEECQNCEYMKWTRISSHTNNTSLIVKTTDRILFSVNDKGGVELCSQNYTFGQHGIYGFNISSEGCSPVFVMKSPDNPYYPLYVFLFCVILYLVLKAIGSIFRKSQLWLRIQQGFTGTPQTDGQGTPTGDVAPLVPSELIPPLRQLQHTRINSLDTFRGLTIALMIFVNYGGGKYWFFEHTTWNGLHVADVVFPWFAWIMGVGIALSVRSKLRSGLKRSTIIRGIFKRAVLLIFLGVFFSNRGNNNTLTLRIPGVLQRLGSSFLIVSFLESVLMKRQPDFQYGRWVILQDILDSWVQWITILFIVGVHTAVTFHLSVPGCPKGYLGPGGLHEHYQFVNCTGGAAGYIDRNTFGDNHIYQKPTSARIYHSDVPFDPEGLLGILTTTLTVYLGVAAGRIILCSNSTEGRIKRWASYAIVTGLIAGFLCDWSKEGGIIPINKNLWSLSFVCITASLAFCMLIFLYLIVDHYHLWSGKLFAQAGMNSIVLYLGHGILKSSWPFSFTPINHTTHTQYFVEDLIGVLIWIFIAARLYKKEIFITV